MNKIFSLAAILLFSSSLALYAQTAEHSVRIRWHEGTQRIAVFADTYKNVLSFDGAAYSDEAPSLPLYIYRLPVDRPGRYDATVRNLKTTPVDLSQVDDRRSVGERLQINTSVQKDRGRYYLVFSFVPIYGTEGNYSRVEEASISIERVSDNPQVSSRGPNKTSSVLSAGEFYKIGIRSEGIHRISYDQLRQIGIQPDNIDPRRIKIYGNEGGMLPEPNATPRIDDLEELAILVDGESDGKFDRNDAVIFYAQGPNSLSYDLTQQRLSWQKNIYDTLNYYFITVSGANGKRMQTSGDPGPADLTVATFDHTIRMEDDLVNIGHFSAFTTGAGKMWYGDYFRNQREKTYNGVFLFEDLVKDEDILVNASFIHRSDRSGRFLLEVEGRSLQSLTISSTSTGSSEASFAQTGTLSGSLRSSTNSVSVKLRYPETESFSEGWLDFIELQARRSLIYRGQPLLFQNILSTTAGVIGFDVKGTSQSGVRFLDLTDSLNPVICTPETTPDGWIIRRPGNRLVRMAAWHLSEELPAPLSLGRIDNQNLHGIQRADMVIIYPAAFAQEAQRLADFRRSHSGLTVETVEIRQVLNEFGGGSLDPVAIRDFARMLYQRDPQFKYLLLFGDASFDYRNILSQDPYAPNYIPCWQTQQSLNPISSFPSDDFFALLDEDEGGNLRGGLDIATGRLPASTAEQARDMVDKIIGYESSRESLGDWRQRLTMVADDEDSDRHMIDADAIAVYTAANYRNYNIDKIYLDAFQQVATPGEDRYPAAKEAINQNMFKGHLVINYLGHGGATGWAQERVLEVTDIHSWKNRNKLPLFVTATCTFASYDNPFQTSAGELTLLNSGGGAIGLFTTSRAVYAHSNFKLAMAVFENIFERIEGRYPPIGEILRVAKNKNTDSSTEINSRKFTLLGDPAMKLAIPQYNVATTTINGRPADSQSPDTLKALGKYTIEGTVTDEQGNVLEWFNGVITPTIYDKVQTLRTLGNDPRSSVRDFKLQRNILFKGSATVQNGRFSFTFILPRDIDYTLGKGKISYYAHDDQKNDAGGYFEDIYIGGSADQVSISEKGPVVELFMNNEDFAYGGMTDPNPILLARLQADNGINVSGTSIGHDLTGTLDQSEQHSFILNDFYEAALDDFTKGAIRYPLQNLQPGIHHIRVKAWDVANQSGEGQIEFTVVNTDNLIIRNLLNYPNPFNRNTAIQFEHNNPYVPMDVQVMIYTVSGRLVKSIEQNIVPEGYLIRDIRWDGQDEYGQRLANGVYLYKVRISQQGLDGARKTIESDFQKMVILN